MNALACALAAATVIGTPTLVALAGELIFGLAAGVRIDRVIRDRRRRRALHRRLAVEPVITEPAHG